MVYSISSKDWQRMADLVKIGQTGEGVASKINSKEKAVARYVAGLKLLGEKTAIKDFGNGNYGLPWTQFKCFGNKALHLGATYEDIQETFEATEKPEGAEKSDKKAYTGFFGSVERLLDNTSRETGWTWKWQSCGNHWSSTTQAMYSRDGRVWPISKLAVFEKDGKKVTIPITVVTNEGGGNYGYDLDRTFYATFREFKKQFTRLFQLKAGEQVMSEVEEPTKKALSEREYQKVVESWLDEEGIDWVYVDAERGQVVDGVFCNYLRFPNNENSHRLARRDYYEIAEKLEKAPDNVKGPDFMTIHAMPWEDSWWIIWNVVDASDYEMELAYDHDMKEDPAWNW